MGIYLDEQPITTIQGALDVHVYDIERVEALAGPQGTLYGASSQAAHDSIITNKPDPTEVRGAAMTSKATCSSGETGYVAEGFAQPAAGRKRRDPTGRLGQARSRLHQQCRSGSSVYETARSPSTTPTGPKKDYNGVEDLRRACRLARGLE